MARPPHFPLAGAPQPLPHTRPLQAGSLDIIAEPRLRRLAEYWQALRAGRLMPARRDIDPLDIPWALPHLFLIDCVSDAGPGADGGRWRYRYRLAGEEIEAVFRSVTGRHSLRNVWLDEMLTPETLLPVMARWRPLPERGCVVYMQGMVYRIADSFACGGRIMLPLADTPGGPVTGLIGATDCDWECRERAPALYDGTTELDVTYIPAAALD